jgi:thiamine biosynthesis lipoprotein
MGSPLRLLVSGPIAERAVDRAWHAVRDEFEAAEAAMSRYRESSEITALCRAAPNGRPVSRRLRSALVAADRAVRLTGGRFEPRIVDDLERLGFGAVPQHDGPHPETRPKGRLLTLEPAGSAALAVPVDLGGIGKGLALRWAARAAGRMLDGSGAAGTLIDAGGDIVARGAPVPEHAWSVGIEDHRGGPIPLAVVSLTGGSAIATSSTRINRLPGPDGRIVHHLIDPRTGGSADGGLVAVTVAFPDPAWAEVWSKSLFVEGRRGIAVLARRHGLAAWWVGEDGRLEMTPAARQLTTWTATGL